MAALCGIAGACAVRPRNEPRARYPPNAPLPVTPWRTSTEHLRAHPRSRLRGAAAAAAAITAAAATGSTPPPTPPPPPPPPPPLAPLGFPVLLEQRRSALTGAPIRCVSLPVRGILGGGGGILGAPLESFCGAHVLLLDETSAVASVFHPSAPGTLTGAYWDSLAAVESLLPKSGAVAIAGLAGGTAAQVLHRVAPTRQMVGFEMDPDVVAVARAHMGLAQLEAAGVLRIVIGDALAAKADPPPSTGGTGGGGGGFSAIFVDLFADALLIPQLTLVATWRAWLRQLAPGGRLLVNLAGGSGDPAEHALTEAAFDALAVACDGAVCVLEPEDPEAQARNIMGLTGPLPGPEWGAALPEELRHWSRGWYVAQEEEEEEEEEEERK